MTDLAVVIVTWNVRELALEAVRSLLADVEAHGPQTDVYVIDCASHDRTPAAIQAAFPSAHVVASDENLGFGRGNNLGILQTGIGGATAKTPSNAVYLLNPDTITQPGATRRLYDALMASPNNGLVGAQLSYGDGSFQHSAFAFPGLRQLWTEFFPTPGSLIEGRFNGRYPRALYAAERPFPVDFVLGATMMLRRDVIEQTGMFDEQFFMYCEEIDWAWRIKSAGWRVLCVPQAHVIHLGGQSTGQAQPQSVINLWTSRLRLYRKHHPAWKYWAARQLIMRGMQRKLGDKNLPPDVADAYRTVYERARAS